MGQLELYTTGGATPSELRFPMDCCLAPQGTPTSYTLGLVQFNPMGPPATDHAYVWPVIAYMNDIVSVVLVIFWWVAEF